MFRKRLIIFLFVFVFCPAVSFAVTVEEITKPLRDKYYSAKTLIISYSQIIQIKGLDRADKFKGRIIFTRPDRFRWEGADAEGRSQIIIIVKHDMLMYLTETDTLTKRKVLGSLEKHLKDRYIPWLDASNDMRTKYSATENENGKKFYKLEVLPESSGEYKNMYFWVDADRHDVVKIEITDIVENRVTLLFDSTVLSMEIPEEEFVFKPKSKTQVIEMDGE